MRFNGSDYDRAHDDARLSVQLIRIRALMRDGQWRTLAEIARDTGDPQASISAQLRHLRKPRFGSWVVEKRSRGVRKDGLYEYRLLPPDPLAANDTLAGGTMVEVPNATELALATTELRALHGIAAARGTPFSPTLVRVCKWIAQGAPRGQRATAAKGAAVPSDSEAGPSPER